MIALAVAFGLTALFSAFFVFVWLYTDDTDRKGNLLGVFMLFVAVWSTYAAGHFAGVWS